MPTIPPAPASMEFMKVALVATNVNPFTGQMQVNAWSANPYFEGSVSMPPMTQSDAANWTAWLTGLNGPASTFTFPPAVIAMFPYELSYDGTTPRIWRLKPGSQVKWSITRGQIYGMTFEVRESL